jgi:pimeloyl-ACP methyl ester carboxylesterase
MSVEYRVQGSGPPIVYVSGIEGTGKLFYKQAADLERDHTIISFPLRGEGRYGMPQLIEDLAWVVRDARAEKATFVGESFGGLLTMAAALAEPELFERLILVNTFPFFSQRARIKLGVLLFSLLPRHMIRVHRTRNARHVLFTDDVSEEERKLFREHTRVVPAEGYVSRMRIIRDTDLRSRLGEIKIPTLVVAGTADRLLDSVSAAKLIAEKMPRARLKLIEGTGHTALLSDRVRVRDWFTEFESL